jgi:hypothetical protein
MRFAVGKNDTLDVRPRLGVGVAAGLAGTVVIHQLRTLNEKLAPRTMVPMAEDPGKFMVQRAEERLPDKAQEQVSEQVENAASMAVHFAYGATMGALYALLRPHAADLLHAKQLVVRDGALVGVGVWALGYLGWLPALRLTPAVHRQSVPQVVLSIVQHALYGITTVGVFAAAARKLAQR